MRKIFILIISLVLVGFTGGVLAQETQEPVALIPEVLPELPSPGLKPGDFFYFLDMWGEAIGEFFTFRAEARALLQTERALERIAEAKALLEIGGIDAPGLIVAEEKIQQNMAEAARILEEQKARGREVSLLAKQLDGEFDTRQILLKGVFTAIKEDLKAQEIAFKTQIREARLAGDFEGLGQLRDSLINIRTQKDKIDLRKDFLKEILETKEKRIETEMEAREKELEILAEEAEDLFNQREKDLEWTFKQKERGLEFQEKALEVQLKQAILVKDTILTEQIRAKLLGLKVQEGVLETEKEALEESLGQEKGKLKIAAAMKERAAEQIEKVREKLLDVKEGLVEIAEVLPVVSGLVDRAESKLALAEQAHAEEKYGGAFRQAIAAEMLARNAERVLEEKEGAAEKLEELGEKLEEADRVKEALREAQKRLEQAPTEAREELEKRVEEARKRYQERLKEIEKAREKVEQAKERAGEGKMEKIEIPRIPKIPVPRIPEVPEIPDRSQQRGPSCQTDRDCVGLICPMVIGGDTPQCNEEIGVCFCGPSWTANNRTPKLTPFPGPSPESIPSPLPTPAPKPTPFPGLSPEPSPELSPESTLEPRPDPRRTRIRDLGI